MTKQEQKNYQKSCDLWIESQELLISELQLKERFTETNIKVHQLSLKNTKESLKHELFQLREFVKQHPTNKF